MITWFSKNGTNSIPQEKPLRSQILSRDGIAQYAAELAERSSVVRERLAEAPLRKRFKANCKVLEKAYFAFAESAREKEVLTAGAEWLLDNYHVIDEQVRDIKRDLPRNYYRALPKLEESEWRGFPRVYRLACDFISHTDASFDIDLLSIYIESFQSANAPASVLKIGEIWAVPIMLRMALVENLRRLASSSLVVRHARQEVEAFCRETIDTVGSAGSDMLVSLVNGIQAHPTVLELGAAYLLRRLRAKGTAAALALQWVDEKLKERGEDPNEILRLEQQGQAADQISVGNSITALKNIGSLNWREWFERVSRVDSILSGEASKVYALSDFITRDIYRHRIEQLAERSRKTETNIAQELVATADARFKSDNPDSHREGHIGYYLTDGGGPQFEAKVGFPPSLKERLGRAARKKALRLYLFGICLLTLLGAYLVFHYNSEHGGSTRASLLLVLLTLIPLSEFATQVVQWIATRFTRPRPLPKLDLEKEVPDSLRTIVAIQTICNDREALERTVESLEIRFLGNEDRNLLYVLLADLTDAPHDIMPGDRGLIAHATECIQNLNARYCSVHDPKFFLLFRKRQWNASENKFMAWERKRGKVMEFNRLLKGATDTSFVHIVGDVEELRKARYVITLDNDTQLPPGSAKKLIGTIAHPLNRPIIDPDSKVVTEGYGLVQPRVGITLQSGMASPFAKTFSGQTGLDPYTKTVSDLYQDVFGEASYIGKGIYCVDTFERCLEGRVPENSLLSHDLFEGLFVRTGLASDVEVFDEFPSRYHADAKRQHRWMRGDWQLLPWVFNPFRGVPSSKPSVSSVRSLGRWKLFDNLRRSLVAPMLFASILGVWSIAQGSQLLSLLFLILLLAFPVLSVVVGLLLDLPFGLSLSTYFRGFFTDLKRSMQQVLLHLIFLPHLAYLSLHAIFITLYRLYISHKHLLEWETAYAAERRLSGSLISFFQAMSPAIFLTLAAQFFLAYVGEDNFLIIPFFLSWYLAPVVAWNVSQPSRAGKQTLAADDLHYLKRLAFSTWSYFDTYLIPEYNFLIPDNLQIVPKRVVAERTSPTNISLSILSVLSAYELGFTPLTGVLTRLLGTITALKKLERFHGHFLNWYEIRQLRSLPPRYISTVDSGNLVGHFIAAKEALQRVPHLPIISADHLRFVKEYLSQALSSEQASERSASLVLGEQNFPDVPHLERLLGVLQTLGLVRQKLNDFGVAKELQRSLDEFCKLEELISWIKYSSFLESLSERGIIPKRLGRISLIIKTRTPTLALLIKLTNRLQKLEVSIDTSKLTEAEQDTFKQFSADLHTASTKLRQFAEMRDTIQTSLQEFIKEADFHFLFDDRKKLFVIGYNIDNGHRDAGYYDLLASEARLASFVAVAKGDIPQTHWFVLNRSLTDASGGKALLSWSATMFEYLMPMLVMRDYPGTLLSETYRTVVKTQQIYARRRGIPWGISESAYSGVDFEKTYQYRAFGIPGLGLKRGLGDDLVVSPYSTLLALPIDPAASVKNLRRLEAVDARGECGFYEAVDFTPERLSAEESCHVVKSFLAHHQGMSLISICNFLKGNIHTERFHADPSISACELLIQERFPTRIPVIVPHQAELSYLERPDMVSKAERSEHLNTAHTIIPRTRVLSNGRYSVLLDNAGGGSSFFDGHIALTRFREDSLTNNWGTFIYVKDRETEDFWSVTYQPTRVEPEEYEVIFNPDKVEYRRRDFGISIHTEITVSPEDNVEIRRLTISNVSSKPRSLDLTSYAEVALAPRQADLSHPAFSKIFIESEFLEDYDALLFSRRPRSEKEKPSFVVHLVTMPVVWAPVQYQTSRSSFIGRGRSVADPVALLPSTFETPYVRPHRVGTVLDPIFSLGTRIEVAPSTSLTVSFITGYASSREEALEMVAKYRETQRVSRAFELAWSQSDVELRHQQFSIAQSHAFQKLANALLYNVPWLRAPSDTIKRNRLPQSGLWRFGISGDEAICLLIVSDPEHADLAHELLLAHEYLRLRGFRFDLVILNEYPGGYMQNFQQDLDLLIKSGYSRDFVEKRAGVFLRVATQLSEEEHILLQSVARVILTGTKGTLAQQMKMGEPLEKTWSAPTQSIASTSTHMPSLGTIEFENGIGGFSLDGKGYSMLLQGDKLPPQPWSNVIANKQFGFLISEIGSGYSWSDNSRENRLTPWWNDPVCDPPGEVVYIRDSESGEFWCPTPRPVRTTAPVKVTHSFGWSQFETEVSDIGSVLTISSSQDEKIKWWHLSLTNHSEEKRHLELFLYVEWVLGVSREDNYRHLQTNYDEETKILYVYNPFNIDFGNQIVFVGSSHDPDSYTADKAEFVGRHGDFGFPILFQHERRPGLGQLLGAKAAPIKLSETVGAGFESGALLKISLTLAPGETRETQFYLAHSDNLGNAKSLAQKCRSLKYRNNAFEKLNHYWSSITQAIQVKTPNRAFDILTNGWLLYQTLSCRINGRTGLYQSSGACGFRDQLQDCMALLYAKPEDSKNQILLHASRQFGEGDVQHWWHPPSGKGIRTKISDNYLWLPFVVMEYLRITGDRSILEEKVAFLEGPPLEPHEMEMYFTPRVSEQDGTIYEHCVISCDRALSLGPNGIPLMMAGDWNDGMNQVGVKMKGESVWLGWFTAYILNGFSQLLEQRKDMYRTQEYRTKAKTIVDAIESHSWDGKWYHRAYFDDGTPIGSEKNPECKIDSLSQSWSVITGLGNKERALQAMGEVYEQLVKPADGIICLLWPPFNKSVPNPGYIQGYLPGLRENGGQYTHAATWVVMAAAMLGQGEKAFELFDFLNPILHTHTSEGIYKYQTEPYATCGDVYSVAPHNGRGGWSWYTGSSGWLYRVAVEHLIGLKVFGDHFMVKPCIPPHWREFDVHLKQRNVEFHIQVKNPNGVESGVTRVTVNGNVVPDMKISLVNQDTKVQVEILMG